MYAPAKFLTGPIFKKNILGLEAVLCQPCFSRLVRDAGATLEGTVCSSRGSLAHGRSRSVGLSVSIDRSFGNFGVLSAQAKVVPLRTLWSSLRARPLVFKLLCVLVSSLSQGSPSRGTIRPPRTCIEPTLQKPEGYITHSALIAPRTRPCPVQQARKVSAAFATKHMPQAPSRSRFAVRARPPGRRVDRPQGRRVR